MGDEGVELAEFLRCGLCGGHDGEEALAEFFWPRVFDVVEDFGGVLTGGLCRDLDERRVDGVDGGSRHEADDETGHPAAPEKRNLTTKTRRHEEEILFVFFVSSCLRGLF